MTYEQAFNNIKAVLSRNDVRVSIAEAQIVLESIARLAENLKPDKPKEDEADG